VAARAILTAFSIAAAPVVTKRSILGPPVGLHRWHHRRMTMAGVHYKKPNRKIDETVFSNPPPASADLSSR